MGTPEPLPARLRKRFDAGSPEYEALLNEAELAIGKACCRYCAFREFSTGECRVDGPRATKDGGRVWPKVGQDDWCGKWASV